MIKKPSWIKTRLAGGERYQQNCRLTRSLHLHTICAEGACPNIGSCWEDGHITFLLMGSHCTRRCRFCNVDAKAPRPLDPEEPQNVAKALTLLNSRYAVLTSVTRDDLEDGGALHFHQTVEAVKALSSEMIIEILIPDFKGKPGALECAVRSPAEVIGHNIETVERLFPIVRPEADYHYSLQVLRNIRPYAESCLIKSALMIGLGEEQAEIEKTFRDLKSAGVQILHIGQYLQPSRNHYPVKKYYTPEEFSELKEVARSIGIAGVMAGPLVRSSYHAIESYREALSAVSA